MKKKLRPIDRAVALFETQAAFAHAIEISPQRLYKWLRKGSAVAPEKCRLIERVTGGKVTAQELRPDIF